MNDRHALRRDRTRLIGGLSLTFFERVIVEKKRAVWFWCLVIGAGFGGMTASWIAPKAISWYFNPPAGFGVSCQAPIDWALQRLQWAQLGGSVIGAAVGLAAYFAIRRKNTDEFRS